MILFDNELICKYCLYVFICKSRAKFYTKECKYGCTYWLLVCFIVVEILILSY